MLKDFRVLGIALFILAMLIGPASAAVNQIAQGGEVFIGEEGLNVTAAVMSYPQIAWFAPGTTPATDTPNYVIAVGNPASFYVAPADFVERTGYWYNWNGANMGVAFNVVNPAIDIKIWDQNANKDVTGKQVPAGNVENFRIETNTYSVVNRPGYAGEGFVTIKVRTAYGATYTALKTPSGVMKALTGQAVTQSLWYWAVPSGNTSVGWDTAAEYGGTRLYPAGPYMVSAELTLNKIRDNYKAPDGSDYTGRTVTPAKTVTIAEDMVLIEASKDTVARGTHFSVTVSGRANEYYYVWINGTDAMSGEPGDQPPIMVPYQENVANDPVTGPYSIGSYVYEGGAGKTLKEDVPIAPENGVLYYAKIKTSSSGTCTLGFLTSSYTDDRTYIIRVENNFGGQYKSAEVDVEVTGEPPVPIPGQTSPPTDPDHDGLYEDMNGNGSIGFGDVVLFFQYIEWIKENEPVSAFDFSGNGMIGFQDVVVFFNQTG